MNHNEFQIKILDQGISNKFPKLGDYVTIHYMGKLLDGTIFDSSYQKNRSYEF